MRPAPRRAALPFLLLAAACGSDAATRERPPAAAATPDSAPRAAAVSGTSTTIQLSPTTVAGGAQYVVRFSIRNDGARSVRMTLSCDAAAILTLRAADAPPGSEPLVTSNCPRMVRMHDVPPRAELVLQLPTSAQAGRPPRALAPGLYVVEATPTVTEIDGWPRTLPSVSAELRVR